MARTQSTEKDDKFQIAMRRYGGRLTAESVHPDTAKGFEEFRATFRHILVGGKQKSQNIYCDWLDNTRFNALATLNDDEEFIGIFAGAAMTMYNHFLAFLSDPAVLPQVGSLAKEEIDQNAIMGLREADITPARLPRNPRDNTRLFAAQHLAWNAVIFLFFHEVAHLALCHLRMLREEVGIAEYIELPMTPVSSDEAHLRVLLEIDADQSAATNTLNRWRSMWLKGLFPALSPLGLEVSWSISIAMLFRIMDAQKAGQPAPGYTTHPPPLVRYIHIVNLGATPGVPQFWGPEEVSLQGFNEVTKWWRSNKLPESSALMGYTPRS